MLCHVVYVYFIIMKVMTVKETITKQTLLFNTIGNVRRTWGEYAFLYTGFSVLHQSALSQGAHCADIIIRNKNK